MPTVNPHLPMQLSDGTRVEFVKVTSKGNIQVRLPTSHSLSRLRDDRNPRLRIFRPEGYHFKCRTQLTLQNVPSETSRVPTSGADLLGPNVTGFEVRIVDGALKVSVLKD